MKFKRMIRNTIKILQHNKKLTKNKKFGRASGSSGIPQYETGGCHSKTMWPFDFDFLRCGCFADLEKSFPFLPTDSRI